MSEVPEVFAIFEHMLAHALSFKVGQKGQKEAVQELLVYFSDIVKRASAAEFRIAELEAENAKQKAWINFLLSFRPEDRSKALNDLNELISLADKL